MFNASPILIVSPEAFHRDKLADDVLRSCLRPVCCDTLAAAKNLIASEQFGVVVIEDSLWDHDLRTLVKDADHTSGRMPVIVVSQSENWDSYLAALDAGAFEYVAYPPAAGELERALWSALSESKRFSRMFLQSAA